MPDDWSLGGRGGWDASTNGTDTGLRLHQGEPWPVIPDLKPDPDNWTDDERMVYTHTAEHRSGIKVPVATLRRIGWLDQRGRVWLKIPSTAKAANLGCGSFTPLLVDPGERT